MVNQALAQIDDIREASRRLVRELGLLRDSMGGVDLPPSAVHALLEIEACDGITAGALAKILVLEKSSVSRLLKKLVESGEVTEGPCSADGRTKRLFLTAKGRATAAAIHDFARRQVADALDRLSAARHQTVTEGLRLYAEALAAGRGDALASPPITIEAGYRAGALGRCAEMHARYYARQAGFSSSFEALVASGLAEFSSRLDRSCNGLWLALWQGRVVGTVAIDGEDMGPGIAHLRWFIMDDGVRGSGAGKGLLLAAMDFCEAQGFEAVHLWTFRGLHAARHLYEAQGFMLAEERPGQQWGTQVTEQRFIRSVRRSR